MLVDPKSVRFLLEMNTPEQREWPRMWTHQDSVGPSLPLSGLVWLTSVPGIQSGALLDEWMTMSNLIFFSHYFPQLRFQYKWWQPTAPQRQLWPCFHQSSDKRSPNGESKLLPSNLEVSKQVGTWAQELCNGLLERDPDIPLGQLWHALNPTGLSEMSTARH